IILRSDKIQCCKIKSKDGLCMPQRYRLCFMQFLFEDARTVARQYPLIRNTYIGYQHWGQVCIVSQVKWIHDGVPVTSSDQEAAVCSFIKCAFIDFFQRKP